MLDYKIAQKVTHWLMAFAIMLDLYVAQKFGGVMEDWDRFESRSDHSTLGTIVTILLIIRIYLRVKHGAAELPATMKPWQRQAAVIGHRALYVLMAGLILSGVASALNATNPVVIFNSFELSLGNQDEDLFLLIRGFHEFATKAMIVLIVGHIVAALYHHFIAKDDSTVKMLKFWRSKAS